MKTIVKKVDAVFEGGGVKGIALVGALASTEAHGYQFENLAGTSAGAIVAALVAAGYPAMKIKLLMENMHYENFKDGSLINSVPLFGNACALLMYRGIYRGDWFARWIKNILAFKGIHTFGDLVIDEYKDNPQFRYKLQVVATDISKGRMVVLPRDAALYGIEPDNLEVWKAIRMSMSIPYFFRPVTFGDSTIVDGALLSNYPVWLLDDTQSPPRWPTFGYRLSDSREEGRMAKVNTPTRMLSALFSTMMEAHDTRYITEHDFSRTIPCPSGDVRVTDFDISREKIEELYQSGYNAAENFFDEWDFGMYKATFRSGQPLLSRRENILYGSRLARHLMRAD